MYANPSVTPIGTYWDDEFASYSEFELKYAPIHRALSAVPEGAVKLIQEMASHLTPQDNMKVLVDYRVRALCAGQHGCQIPGWHIDRVVNPNHKWAPETHVIYSTVVGTEFLKNQLEYSEDDVHFKQILARLDPKEEKVLRVPPNTITKYSRMNFHRGPKIEKDCKRLLIRLTQTQVK